MPHPRDGGCLNCGAALVGPYCHRCGQEAFDKRRPLRALVSDALGDLVSFDSRILRTLGPLLVRPGFLTVEWAAGRRVDYVPPLRLYVFTAAIFFFVIAATGASVVQLTTSESGEKITVEELARSAERAPVPEPGARETGEAAEGDDTFGARLSRAVGSDAGRFKGDVVDTLATFSLFLAPASALILALLYRRRYLVEHVVFTLHLHVFIYLVLTASILGTGGARDSMAGVVVVPVVAVYTLLALRRFYGGRWWSTALRAAALSVLYILLVLLPTFFVSFMWTVYSAS